MNIALIYGGNSSEREISVLSGKNIAANLCREGRNVFEIDVYYNNWKLVAVNGMEIQPVQVDKNGFTVVWDDTQISFDVALLMIHGTPGEDGLFISYLEMMGIPHTGCPARVALMAFDKYACKTFLRPTGIKMPRACRITEKTLTREWQGEVPRVLGPPPWFVKPVSGGSSFGISKVREQEDLLSAVEEALKEDTQVLIEEYIEGTEVTNGIMKTREKAYVLPVTEIVPHKECEFFDYNAKYKGASAEITPARISPELTERVQQTTSLIYDTLVCRGIVRVDYIIRENEVYFLEVNTVPGMTTRSLVPQEIEAAGFTLSEFLDELLRAAIDEYQGV
ncbi:MAG TPA: D-alanine--D-alanine ligase [Bacteroidales bacterium]|nr:D-alanine--D-alanine ligase [Bacteroidales bacterium]